MNWIFGLLIAAGFSAAASAQGYPSKPVKIVVPFAAGGTADISARGIASGLSEALQQTVFVENRPGAGGTIGAEYVARSAPDGHTLLLGSNSTLSVAPALYKSLRYDPIKDFLPITLVAATPMVLVVNPANPAKTITEVIATAKNSPGRLTMASGGLGSMNQISGELFQSLTGTRFTHVPYKGSGPAIVAVISGEVDMLFDQLASSVNHINSGKLRAVGIAASGRNALVPQVPTMAEGGISNYEVTSITGLLTPAGTPMEIVQTLHAASVKVLASSDVQERFKKVGIDAKPSTPAEFEAFIKADLMRWTQIVREANITLE